MTWLDGTVHGRCNGRLKLVCVRACVLTVLTWLALYALTITLNADSRAVEPQPEWLNLSAKLESAVQKIQITTVLPRKRKLILLWTPYFSTIDWLPTTVDLQCDVNDCDVTSNRSFLSCSSATVLHWRNVDVNDLPNCGPSDTCPPWILFNKEAPPHTPRATLEKLQDKVHWTATYRRDSTFYAPYGMVLKETENNSVVPETNPDHRRLVCWLVSNCDTPSKREDFVHELQKHVEVDIYGKCGTAKCPHTLTKDCYHWLADKCKFYLSLENSNCRDYVTEKLFYAMSSGMVPIVMSNTTNYSQLPARSYISASDFPSPKELAQYLVMVGNDQKMYRSYHLWRTKYEVKDSAFRWLCEVCKKLHETDVQTLKPFGNLTSWWFDLSGCMS